MLQPPDHAVLDATDADFEPVAPAPASGTGGVRSWLSGDPDGDRCRVRFFFRKSDGAARCRVWFGPGTEGPPGHVHGGCLTTVLDSVMGGCAWLNHHHVLAANLNVNFRTAVPLGTIAIAEARVIGVSGRKITVEGSLILPNGVVASDARGLFVVLPAERLAALARSRDALTPPG